MKMRNRCDLSRCADRPFIRLYITSLRGQIFFCSWFRRSLVTAATTHQRVILEARQMIESGSVPIFKFDLEVCSKGEEKCH